MKTIRLTHITVNDSSYSISLGNGFTFHFTSKRLALAFLSSTNKFLTNTLAELNIRYADVQTAYRENWILFTTHSKVLQDERLCAALLADVDFLLSRAFYRMNSQNANMFTFQSMSRSAEFLLRVVITLRSYHKIRSETFHVRKLNLQIKSLTALLHEIETFGQSEAAAFERKEFPIQQIIPFTTKHKQHA